MHNMGSMIFKKTRIVLFTVFFSLFGLYPSYSDTTSPPYMEFRAPYTHMGGALEWDKDVGVAESTARANATTGYMGVFGTGYIGGATSQAGLWMKIFAPDAMHLKVTAKIRYMGGISGFGYGECSGFKFKWTVNGKKSERQIEGGITPEWVADKTLDVAELALDAITLPVQNQTIETIEDLLDLLQDLQDVSEFVHLVNEIATILDNGKTEIVSFDFDAKKGWNDIEIAVQGGVGAAVTGFAMYMVIGYLESIRIDGLGYPDLVVGNLSITSEDSCYSPNPEVGKPAKLKFKIANRGNLESKGTSVNITINNQSYNQAVPPLKPEGEKDFEVDFIFPQESIDIKVHADPNDDIFELDYDWGADQEKYYEHFEIPPPAQDLHLKNGGNLLELRAYGMAPWSPALADLRFGKSPPSFMIEDGETSELKFTVVNEGGTDRCNRCKTAENIVATVKIPDVKWEETKTIPSLESGEGKELTFNIPAIKRPKKLPSGEGWGVKVEEIIDPNNQIEERNEGNNSNISHIQVRAATLPQLQIASFSVSPRAPSYEEGQSITLDTQVEYYGKKSLENVEVAFYYNGGIWGKTLNLILIETKRIDFEESGMKDVSVVWPAWKSGHIYTDIYCVVDPRNRVKENDESESVHRAIVGIKVEKKKEMEVTEKPIEGKPVVEGVDLAVEDKDVFLEKKDFLSSDYLGVWVHNRGNESARGQVHLTASWIETDPQGKKRAVTKELSQIGDTIKPASSKLFKISFKTLSHKGFMGSFHVKMVVDVYPKEDADPSNNSAVFKVGDFDGVAEKLKRGEDTEKQAADNKPDLKVMDIQNIEPPLKVGEKREFQILIKNNSTVDVDDFNVDCVVRPKGSGRPHPELGWKQFTKHFQQLKAGEQISVTIEYTPIRKGVYEIVASLTSIKWGGGWTGDADRTNNSMLKYFGIETAVDTVGQPSPQPEQPQRSDLDLAATDIWIDNKTPNVGEVISGGFTVHNSSPVDLKNVAWKVYADADEVASGVIEHMAANTDYTVDVSSQADQEGTFVIKSIVDPDNKIPESDETNNEVTRQLTITATSQPILLPKVDVVVTSVVLGKSRIKVGEKIEAKATITNKGSDTVRAVPVAFVVSDRDFSVQVIDALAPGESKTVTAPLIGLMGGSYTITVIADRRQLIKEINEQNNRGNAALTVERLLK